MILQYSFRKSFIISNAPLKPDEQPIQQLLPPQIPPSSLVRTYSFSQLKNNESIKQQLNQQSSLEMGKGHKVIEQLEAKIEELVIELKKQKQRRVKISQQHKEMQQKYQGLLKQGKQKQSEETIKQEKKELMRLINGLRQQIGVLKGQLVEKSEQLIIYESRSEQSRRLLQKLNENINKKESKLLKDKQIIVKQLEETKKLLHQTQSKLQQSQLQLDQTSAQLQTLKLSKLTQANQQITKDFQLQLLSKDRQIQSLVEKISQIQLQYQRQIDHIKSSMNQEQSAKLNNQALIKKLQHQLETSNQIAEQFQAKNSELTAIVSNLESRLQEEHKNSQTLDQTQKSRIQKLQYQITNSQFNEKENEQKISHLEEEIQRINMLVNQIKEDKRLLNREKEELKIQLNQKSTALQNMRNRLQQIKQTQIKHKSMIQNFQKEQQRLYDQEARQLQKIAGLEIKVKSSAIQLSKMNLCLSQRQEQLNKVNKEMQKYKKQYKKQHQTLEMYKQETLVVKQKTQQKWNELKLYYENQISLLEEKINRLETNSCNDSRIKIKNLITNQKARIATSRLSIARNPSSSQDKQQTKSVDRLDTQSAVRKKLLFRENDPQHELKENYWHGLNDSLEHSDQEPLKN